MITESARTCQPHRRQPKFCCAAVSTNMNMGRLCSLRRIEKELIGSYIVNCRHNLILFVERSGRLRTWNKGLTQQIIRTAYTGCSKACFHAGEAVLQWPKTQSFSSFRPTPSRSRGARRISHGRNFLPTLIES